MSGNDEQYYLARGIQLRTKAAFADDPHVAQEDLAMARRYDAWAEAARKASQIGATVPQLGSLHVAQTLCR